MNIILSKSESHPAQQDAFPLNKEDKRVLFVFGLAKKRGDNIVSSSRISDSFFTVLTEQTPRMTYYEIPELDPVEFDNGEFKRKMDEMGMRVDSVGIAYNTRKTLNAEQYKKLLEAIGKAVE